MPYLRKSEGEIEKLAWDVVAGHVFGSWMIQSARDIQMCFMVLVFLKKEEIEQLQRDGIVHLYEYMDKAAPRSINGNPIFFSAHYLDNHDSDILSRKIKEIQTIRQTRMIKASES